MFDVWLHTTLASARTLSCCHVLTFVSAVMICHPQSGPMSSSPINSTSLPKNHLCRVSIWLLHLLSQAGESVLFDNLEIDLLCVYFLRELRWEDGIPQDLLLGGIKLHSHWGACCFD